MQNPDEFGRFSSCRGVAFEIKPRADPFAIPALSPRITDALPECNGSQRSNWLAWGKMSITLQASDIFSRSMSRVSSHFCDLYDDLDREDVETLVDMEEGHEDQKPGEISVAQQERKSSSSPSRLSVILLDQGLFTVYKQLWVVCVALNITGLVLAVTGEFPYARDRPALFSIANVFALVLCRSEAFLRVVFWLVVKLLGHSRIPLRLKTMATAFLQSLGGIHSGCGISSIAWLVYAIMKTREDVSPEIITVSLAILAMLCLSSLAAFPLVRHVHHNVFERTHRFAGWMALSLLWTFVIFSISYDPETKIYRHEYLFKKLIERQEFWFSVGITVLIILPWLTVRRVPVQVSSPSGHASVIKFAGGIKAGILGRISPSPFSEWHAFGIISDNRTEHMMLAGAVGDFTKSLVINPPTHLWVRTIHFAGLPYLTNMYNRVLLVATGSGICVFLSFLLQPCKAEVFLLWVTKNVEQNFGREIKEWVSVYPEEKVIVHDTAVLGRPNVSEMSVETAKRFGAEVVIVTSNPEGSRDVVTACKAAGIPAFGPIWDS